MIKTPGMVVSVMIIFVRRDIWIRQWHKYIG
jgi:hypothetical protein